MNKKIEIQNASYRNIKNEKEMLSPKLNNQGFEQFEDKRDNYNGNKIVKNEYDMETNRTTDSLDVFPANYFNKQLQEIESNMKMLSGDTISLNNMNNIRTTKSATKENKLLGDYTKVGKKVLFNEKDNQ